jgi:hypothetical protein
VKVKVPSVAARDLRVKTGLASSRRFSPSPLVPSSEPAQLVERRVTMLLRPLFTDLFRVIYDPAFPRTDGSTLEWFQVIFAVGPTDDVSARTKVHERFVELLAALAPLEEVRHADTVSLRARRHILARTAPDHPHMFIECSWRGAAVADMQRTQHFSGWHSHCDFYVNRFDRSDPLNTNQRRA